MKRAPYFELVYELVRLIPPGRVSTYGHLSNFLSLGSARMVGWALNHSHTAHDIPAHRVVNRKGELSGRHHFNPPAAMQWMLESEGLKIVDHKIVNFETSVWNPSIELI